VRPDGRHTQSARTATSDARGTMGGAAGTAGAATDAAIAPMPPAMCSTRRKLHDTALRDGQRCAAARYHARCEPGQHTGIVRVPACARPHSRAMAAQRGRAVGRRAMARGTTHAAVSPTAQPRAEHAAQPTRCCVRGGSPCNNGAPMAKEEHAMTEEQTTPHQSMWLDARPTERYRHAACRGADACNNNNSSGPADAVDGAPNPAPMPCDDTFSTWYQELCGEHNVPLNVAAASAAMMSALPLQHWTPAQRQTSAVACIRLGFKWLFDCTLGVQLLALNAACRRRHAVATAADDDIDWSTEEVRVMRDLGWNITPFFHRLIPLCEHASARHRTAPHAPVTSCSPCAAQRAAAPPGTPPEPRMPHAAQRRRCLSERADAARARPPPDHHARALRPRPLPLQYMLPLLCCPGPASVPARSGRPAAAAVPAAHSAPSAWMQRHTGRRMLRGPAVLPRSAPTSRSRAIAVVDPPSLIPARRARHPQQQEPPHATRPRSPTEPHQARDPSYALA